MGIRITLSDLAAEISCAITGSAIGYMLCRTADEITHDIQLARAEALVRYSSQLMNEINNPFDRTLGNYLKEPEATETSPYSGFF